MSVNHDVRRVDERLYEPIADAYILYISLHVTKLQYYGAGQGLMQTDACLVVLCSLVVVSEYYQNGVSYSQNGVSYSRGLKSRGIYYRAEGIYLQ